MPKYVAGLSLVKRRSRHVFANYREAVSALHAGGAVWRRNSGGHAIWRYGRQRIVVPSHGAAWRGQRARTHTRIITRALRGDQ